MPKFFSVWPKKLMDENDPFLNFQFATEQKTIYGRKILIMRKVYLHYCRIFQKFKPYSVNNTCLLTVELTRKY